MHYIKQTKSICPEDLKVLDAELWEIGNQVIMKKNCPEHGHFEDVYWGNYEEYLRVQQFSNQGRGLDHTKKSELGCPYDCGLCENHKVHTTLLIIELNNQCNLQCPICYAEANSKEEVKELSKEQVRKILEYAHQVNKPYKVGGIANSGGEPTLRDDLPEIIQMEKDLGYNYIMVLTNGLRLAEDLEYFKKLRDLDVLIYLQFDGVSPEPYLKIRGRDLWSVKQKVIENARLIGYNKLTLVPTLTKSINDHQVGDILRFAAKNIDVVKYVSFQPVTFSGRINRSQLKQKRITIPDVLKLLNEQTQGEIQEGDFFPLSMTQTLGEMVTKGGKPQDFCVHPHCGMVTTVDYKNGKFSPIPRLINNEKLYHTMHRAFELKWPRWKIFLTLAVSLIRYVNPKLWVKLIPAILLTQDSPKAVKTLITDWLPDQWLTIGIMHFMDPHNFDLERLQNCNFHVGILDQDSNPKLIPFCSMNNIHRTPPPTP
ncbi:tetraether lipid synthase Tes [Deltaproteobacteria bacterium TL4]